MQREPPGEFQELDMPLNSKNSFENQGMSLDQNNTNAARKSQTNSSSSNNMMMISPRFSPSSHASASPFAFSGFTPFSLTPAAVVAPATTPPTTVNFQGLQFLASTSTSSLVGPPFPFASSSSSSAVSVPTLKPLTSSPSLSPSPGSIPFGYRPVLASPDLKPNMGQLSAAEAVLPPMGIFQEVETEFPQKFRNLTSPSTSSTPKSRTQLGRISKTGGEKGKEGVKTAKIEPLLTGTQSRSIEESASSPAASSQGQTPKPKRNRGRLQQTCRGCQRKLAQSWVQGSVARYCEECKEKQKNEESEKGFVRKRRGGFRRKDPGKGRETSEKTDSGADTDIEGEMEGSRDNSVSDLEEKRGKEKQRGEEEEDEEQEEQGEQGDNFEEKEKQVENQEESDDGGAGELRNRMKLDFIVN